MHLLLYVFWLHWLGSMKDILGPHKCVQHLECFSHFCTASVCAWHTHTDHAVCNRCSKGPHLHIVRVQPQNWVCSCVGAVLCTLFIFSEIERMADNLSGASSNSRDWKVTLAKAARLLNELATTLSELQEADPAHQYTQAANEQT